jgi:hypothetical protein
LYGVLTLLEILENALASRGAQAMQAFVSTLLEILDYHGALRYRIDCSDSFNPS